jgi:uncharacterized membrane protein
MIDDIVDAYLARLRDELRDLPRSGRQEVVQEIEEHIATARAELHPESEARVRNILERLGDPAEIADDARERFDVERPRHGWQEVATLVLLPIGGVILPVVGWFVGVLLLWLSDCWTRRDKLIGTFVIPGGLFLPLAFFVFGQEVEGCTSGSATLQPAAGQPSPCTDQGGSLNVLPFVLLGAPVLAPFVTDWYLARRLRR